MTDTGYLPTGRRSVQLRGTQIRAAEQVRDSLNDEERALRNFYRDYVVLSTRAKLGPDAVVSFLSDYSPIWDGGRDEGTGKIYHPFWPRFIAACRANGVDPAEYLVWRHSVWNGGVPSSPVEIERNYFFQQFIKRDSQEDVAKVNLITMQSQLKQAAFKNKTVLGYSDAAANRAALLGGLREQMTKLFVYVSAIRLNLRDVADQVYSAAIYEYALDRATLDRVWGDLIPADFRNTPSMTLLTRVQGRA